MYFVIAILGVEYAIKVGGLGRSRIGPMANCKGGQSNPYRDEPVLSIEEGARITARNDEHQAAFKIQPIACIQQSSLFRLL